MSTTCCFFDTDNSELQCREVALFTLADLTYAVLESGRESGVDLRMTVHALCFVAGLIGLQMFAIGFGISLTVPTLTATAVSHVSSDKSGVASAIVNASRKVGGLIGVAIFSLLINVADASQFGRGFAQVIVLSSLLLTVGWALTLLLLRKQPLAVQSATAGMRAGMKSPTPARR